MKILAMSGSLRTGSYNTLLLEAARQYFPAGTEYQLQSIDVPLYNEELDGENKPATIVAIKAAIAAADGILIATPEYNYGIPGGLKNALDWISRPAFKSPIVNKPVAIMSAAKSPTGGARAQGQVKQVLAGMLADIYSAPEFLVPLAQNVFSTGGELTDAEIARKLERFIRDFAAYASVR
jgi:chromate reductase